MNESADGAHPTARARLGFVDRNGDLAVRVRQRRFEPLVRWCLFAAAIALLALGFAALLRVGLPPTWPWRMAMVALALVLFVGVLLCLAALLMVVPVALLRRGTVAFVVRPLGIAIETPARRGLPPELHRDALAGPFVRVAEAIDEEASATTMMRMGGEDMALALAEGARSAGGSADTATWFLFRSSAASVTVLYRGFTVVLAEGLRREEAEEIAHRVARVLERLPG